ncbi:hypothetical protein [Prosthecobacter sp.]|uniref:hypothetical protein n=1 Tax=Prosthecobacter sp. TaxID=1965333 RepID=UPI001D6581A6|nr:hypothetical protein [Prosthecobacter sp.]MCB1279326.1 hypothetical protein [Prosthecobacter sp.]
MNTFTKLLKILPLVAMALLTSCHSHDFKPIREVDDPSHGTGTWNWHPFHFN